MSQPLALLSERGPELAEDAALPLRRYPDAPTLEAWRRLASGTVTFDEYYRQMQRDRRLTFLTIDVTGVCDLMCSGMCYYHPDTDRRKALVPEESLKTAITEATDTWAFKRWWWPVRSPSSIPSDCLRC